jgi:hypothetical protein
MHAAKKYQKINSFQQNAVQSVTLAALPEV